MKRVFEWLLINGVLAIALYFGFVEGVEGAYNVAMLVTWFTIITSPFYFADEMIQKMRKKGRSVPKLISLAFDFSVLFFLAWHGAAATAGFYVIHMICFEGAWDKANKATETK